MKIPDRERIIALAGERVFKRGEEYFVWGRVRAMTASEGRVSALVDGHQSYRASLRIDHTRISHDCECPEGRAKRFCKHCVALTLAWIESQPNGVWSTLDEDRRFLEFAVETAATAEDDVFTKDSGQNILDDVESFLNDLLREGSAEAVLTLTEDSLAMIPRQGNPTEAAQRLSYLLREFHRAACRQLALGPVEIAGRLFDLQMKCIGLESGPLFDLEQGYGDLLGAKGLDVYRHLLEREWMEAQANGKPKNSKNHEKQVRVAELVGRLAETRGDLETLVAVKSIQPRGAESYLEIARLCLARGEFEVARQWAWEGKGRFPALETENLDEFLITQYRQRAEWEEALKVAFTRFAVRPSLRDYQRIAEDARRIGQWEVWRGRALRIAEQVLAEPHLTLRRRSRKEAEPERSELVRILLWEKDEEAAWKMAQRGECDDELRLELAGRRAKKYPEDALQVYRRLAKREASRKNNYAYHRAIALLQKVGRILKRQNRKDEFIQYAESVRDAHRTQRNFVKLIDRMIAGDDRK